MPQKTKKLCAQHGCNRFADTGNYCSEHARVVAARQDNRRGTAAERGYDWQWHKFRDMYLARPENQFCRLHLSPRCSVLAQCVDHIVPLELGGAKYDEKNLQPACLACNTLKGQQVLRGTWEPGGGQ